VSRQFAIIVGSGFEAFAASGDPHRVHTRFGPPSAPIHPVTFEGHTVLVLVRHGDNHSLPPHLVNYRANLESLKDVGADAVIALNTVGVISGIREPGQIAIPDQIIDYTWGREHTIYSEPEPGFEHVEFTEPFSPALRSELLAAAVAAGVECHDGGVYAATQGPRLESAAEIDRLDNDGADFVGMTAMPEASIARELALDYACISLVVNKAAGRGDSPIHNDIKSSTLSARMHAMKLLKAFFDAL
jgi:5'-methylthioinosine phosphorylase